MESSLLSLYASILVPVYSEWVGKEDLCFLDTAVCNRKLRTSFLEVLSRCHDSDLLNEESKSFCWMIRRGLRVKKLRVFHWTPVIDALFETQRLQRLNIELEKLAVHLGKIQTSVIDIIVSLPRSFDDSLLKIAGHVITDLSITFDDDTTAISTIVACCPNLRKVSASNRSFVLPLVDACQLDEINMCYLDSLVKRQKCSWTLWSYSCNLCRTSVVDETAVCLGEGKYYRLTTLHCRDNNMTEEEADLLIPLMPHLTDLTIAGNLGFKIASAAATQCHRLTELNIFNTVVPLRDLRRLLKQSPLLRRLYVDKDETYHNVDAWIEVIPECCPLLEMCTLNGFVVESESAMTAMFLKCHFLTDFSADQWPCDALLPFAVNGESLSVDRELHARKSGRGHRRLEIPNQLSGEALCALFPQNPELRNVRITDWREEFSCVINAMVMSCPLLTSVDVTVCNVCEDGTSLVGLGRLLHLTSLSVRHFKSFTVESLSAMLENKTTSLLHLTLGNCNVSGNMLAVIGKLCPALIVLDLTHNQGIQSADVVNLLSSCSKLEALSLRSCFRVTSEILSSVKSPPMKGLNAYGTGISKIDMTRFEGVEGFKYEV